MKYTIHNIRHEVHDLDDEIVDFRFDIHFTEPEALTIKNYFYPYHRLLRWLEEKHPEFYRYLKSVRRGLDAWGPAQAQTFNAMGEEALQQLYKRLEEYLLESDWVQQLFEHEKSQRSLPLQEQVKQQEKVAEAFRKLSKGASAMKEATNRHYRFCETVEKKIRETAVEIYPEIADLAPEKLSAGLTPLPLGISGSKTHRAFEPVLQ